MINAILALAVIGAVLGVILGIADKYLKVEVDNRIEVVTSKLAGANCGGCGYPGCQGFATALVEGEVDKVSRCAPTSAEKKAEIVEFLNTTPGPDGNTLKVSL
ncbi:ferredoxin [Clostridiales bacterium CHKCI006]|uniref:Electron transporter RnfB n=1 Tax=Candidatus Fimiplasma intestinipullorum TaxID=2840825 RepID=A0A9D1HPY7_9FIRM|nr:ferredoxin [Clostridiales bacterium CHKCI006]HIU13354.1 electron transporter RnfB [Candidatus Fimiplasma intestinipullorum]